MSRYYAATTPTWHTPRSTNLEWMLAYLVVLDGFCQFMFWVPVIGYWLGLLGQAFSVVIFTLVVLLLRVRGKEC